MTAFDYARQKSATFENELFDFLRIPSISTDPAYREDCAQAAKWLAEKMTSIGLHAEVIPTQRHPLVYAEWLEAGEDAPTVLIYGHYDVQPAVVEDGWDTEPFEPIVREGIVYARGATDDKGQMYTHLKAVESLLNSEEGLPVNVKFLIEGEEESGGESIARYVAENPEKLKADVCLISDTSMADINQPVIVYALRGVVAFEVIVRGPSSDLHSGMFGGTVHNPVQALAEIIAQLHNDDGSVAVPGFYDHVRVLGDEERQAIAKVPYTNVDWAQDTGAVLPWGEADYTLQERIGARPTLEINGMAGGYFGAGIKAIIPAEARAKMTCRLVADQDPDTIMGLVEKYLKKITPPTVTLEINRFGGAHGAQVDINDPMMQVAIQAYEAGWGAKPVFKREGGSLPIVADFQNKLNLPVILMGFGLNSDGLHGPNEHYSLEMFHKGIQTSITFLQRLAQQKKTG
jgi:acetylornithine deacetylase/succinyl-diaminopimelate desuccinylase-like protein